MNQKILGIVAGVFITLAILGSFAFVVAQSSVDKTSKYTDEDNNGVCDNVQSGNCPYQNQSGGFTDADGDGVCDNKANCPMHQNKGGCPGSGECPYEKFGRMNCHG